jgi:hypothetical protein
MPFSSLTFKGSRHGFAETKFSGDCVAWNIRNFKFGLLTAGFFAASFLCLGEVSAAIEGQLSYSVDGGQTYSEDLPVIAVPQEVYVRADWVVHDEDRPIKDNVVITSLHSEEGDFGSANLGKQNWGGVPAWYQRIEKSWFNVKSEHTAIYRLDLRARPDGVMGKNNVWDKQAGKYADAPLAAVEALSLGVHNFVFEAAYRVDGESTPESAKLLFQVTIGAAPSK